MVISIDTSYDTVKLGDTIIFVDTVIETVFDTTIYTFFFTDTVLDTFFFTDTHFIHETVIDTSLIPQYNGWVIMCTNTGHGHVKAVPPWDIEERLAHGWEIATPECLEGINP